MRWQVKQRDCGDWGIRRVNEPYWFDAFDSHSEAVVWAEREAVMDMIVDGCLARVGELKKWLNAGYR